MKLRVTDDAPAGLSFPYTGALAPGDTFAVDDGKGEALLEAHDYLSRIDHVTDVEYREVDEDEAGGGDGGDDGDEGLSELTKSELYDMAAERDIEGRSDMNKPDLIAALSED